MSFGSMLVYVGPFRYILTPKQTDNFKVNVMLQFSFSIFKQTNKQTNKQQTNKQTNNQPNKQTTNKQTNKQTTNQTNKQPNKQTTNQTNKHKLQTNEQTNQTNIQTREVYPRSTMFIIQTESHSAPLACGIT